MSVEQLTSNNGQLMIYDLAGCRVTGTEKPGIYIVGGKKMMIK